MSDAADPESVEAERAVRQYLQWLADPAALVDPELIASLEAEVAAATDPLELLKLRSKLQRAREVDGDRFRVAFIRWAKSWADRHEVTVDAFRDAGVDDTLLRAAGLGLNGQARGRRPSSAGSTSSGGTASSGAGRVSAAGPRGASVSVASIKQAVAAWSGEFVLADVVAKIGGSPMTVRKAVDELVEAGTVRRIGPRQSHHGPGRAPTVFRVV